MFPFDDTRLRSLVKRDYESLAHNVEDAATMNQIIDAILSTAFSTVIELLCNFNQKRAITCLPEDTLSACFSYLPFLSRVSASHVCRTWRAAAVSGPDLWVTISSYFNSTAQIRLIEMALSRTADRPLAVEVYPMQSAPIEVLSAVLEPYSHQIRCIGWYGGKQTTLWQCPAPRLRHLHCKRTLVIQGDCLGGSPGSLRSLHFYSGAFPAFCPALATVVDLQIDDCKYRKNAFSYGRLFDLFPLLESLSLSRLKHRFASRLPNGPAPASLRQLTLQTTDHEYDLAQHYEAWETGTIRRVSLEMTAVCARSISSLVRGATVLDITYSAVHKEAVLLSSHPNSISRSMSLTTPASIAPFPDALRSARAGLSHVSSLRLSHCFLPAFIPVLEHLPALITVVVHVGPETATYAWPEESQHTFDWAPLLYLPRVVRAVPGLQSLSLQVVCSQCHRDCSPDATDARGLLDAFNMCEDLPAMVVRGFPDAALQGIDAPRGIQFDSAGDTGPLVSHTMEAEEFWPQAFEREWQWEDRKEHRLIDSIMKPYRH